MTRRFRVRTAFLSAFISVAVVALAACGSSGNTAATSAATSTPTSAFARPDAPPDPQTLESAGAAAVAKVPDSTLIFIRTDQGGGWKVHVVTPDGTEQGMDVSSDGFTVLVGPTPQNDSDAAKAKRRALVKAASVDYHAAVDKILAALPGGGISELKLGEDNGTTVWEADAWDTNLVEHIVTINAASGELIADKQV